MEVGHRRLGIHEPVHVVSCNLILLEIHIPSNGENTVDLFIVVEWRNIEGPHLSRAFNHTVYGDT